jgi:hypothetical protein
MIIETDARVLAEHFELLAKRAGPRAAHFTRTRAQHLQSIVRGRASGPPGPQVITGDYVGSIGVEVSQDEDGIYRGEVGTDHPEGFRLERGYHGTDRLGRHFVESPGHPHFGPSYELAAPLIADSAVQIVEDL